MSLLVIVLGPLSEELRLNLEQTLGSEFSLFQVEFVDASNRPEWLEWSSESDSKILGVGKGAAGCWLAHRQAWIEARESRCENVLILEDDARITKYGKRHLDQVIDEFNDSGYSILHLGDHERSIFFTPKLLIKSGNLRKIAKHFLERFVLYPLKPRIARNRFPYSAHAYLLNQSIIPVLIKNAPTFIFPVDVYLNAISQVPNNRVASVRTPLIVQANKRASLIDKFGR